MAMSAEEWEAFRAARHQGRVHRRGGRGEERPRHLGGRDRHSL